MSYWKKPVLVNAAVAALLLLVDGIAGGMGDGMYIPRFALSGTMILLLAPVNLIIGMVRNRNRQKDGPVYLILSGVLLLIGFSVCTIP